MTRLTGGFVNASVHIRATAFSAFSFHNPDLAYPFSNDDRLQSWRAKRDPRAPTLAAIMARQILDHVIAKPFAGFAIPKALVQGLEINQSLPSGLWRRRVTYVLYFVHCHCSFHFASGVIVPGKFFHLCLSASRLESFPRS
ncbi:MAG: hypothetical protein KGJ60_09525 [Verrucomicrobiota bacterium]|nr:hypothetical protein [Verrucomicrobiota bacterium]